MTAEKNRDKTSKFDSKYTYMHKLYALLLSICVSFFVQLQAQGTCNPAANIIIYANYDGGNLTIDIDENVPDIRIGICTYMRTTRSTAWANSASSKASPEFLRYSNCTAQ